MAPSKAKYNRDLPFPEFQLRWTPEMKKRVLELFEEEKRHSRPEGRESKITYVGPAKKLKKEFPEHFGQYRYTDEVEKAIKLLNSKTSRWGKFCGKFGFSE